MSYKLVIKGGYGLTNFGDDALMYVLSLNLKAHFEENEVAFACYKSNYNQQFSNGYRIEPVENAKIIKTELLLYGGGTQFYSFLPKRSIGRIFLSNIKALLLKPNSLISKFRKDKKSIGYKSVAAIGIGVGPFLKAADPTPEKNAKDIFSQFSFVSVRDKYSFEKMKEWKIDDAKMNADICFLMDNNRYTNKKTNINSIGIIVRDWDLTIEGKAYYNKIEIIATELKERGFEVTLIIFAKKTDKYWNRKKNKFLNVLEWDPENSTIEEFMDKLSYFDLFLTARYHGAIFASLLNTPFISIGVEQKLSLISNIYKNCSKIWEYPFEVDDCLEYIKEIDLNYSEYTKNIFLETTIQKQQASEMFNNFIDYCKTIEILENKGSK